MNEDVRIVTSALSPQCQRCAGEAIIAVDIPDSWADGEEGYRTLRRFVLCRRCDARDPDALPLLAMFTVHDEITAETVAECGAMLRAWIHALRNRQATVQEQAEEEAQYLRGEM